LASLFEYFSEFGAIGEVCCEHEVKRHEKLELAEGTKFLLLQPGKTFNEGHFNEARRGTNVQWRAEEIW
jgi:hypothetical protein